MKETTFTGAKSGSGVTEWIINHVPQCDFFVEGFTGTGVISRTLEESHADIGAIYCLEINPQTFQKLKTQAGDSWIRFYCADAMNWIQKDAEIRQFTERDCFYFDPPYRMDSRTHKRQYYGAYDWDEFEHLRFFELVKKLNKIGCMILISHYPDPVYDEEFKYWHNEDFRTRTRTRTVTERLYWNFDLNEHLLATTDFLGKNFTDRQRIKRKVERTAQKINSLPRHERQAIIDELLKTGR